MIETAKDKGMKKRKITEYIKSINKQRLLMKLWFVLIIFIIPFVIFAVTLNMIISKSWMTDAMGNCVNTIMVVSSWIIVAYEFVSRYDKLKKDEKGEPDFRLVDCMTIILTVITICYSFLQICNPPILFKHVLKLILWFSAIITYTIWAKPTRMKVLSLCLVATLISTLFVLPVTYQEYYEGVIEDCKRASYSVDSEEIYDFKNGSISSAERIQKEEDLSGFNELLADEYFTKNYKETLVPAVKKYMEFRKKGDTPEITLDDVHFSYELSNYRQPKVFIWSSKPFFYEFDIVADETEIDNIKTERVVEVGFTGERLLGVDGNRVVIRYDNIKGLSGIKYVTFLKGFVQDTTGVEMSENWSADFVFYGYDVVIWACVMLYMLNMVLQFTIAKMRITDKKKNVIGITIGLAVDLSICFMVYLMIRQVSWFF